MDGLSSGDDEAKVYRRLCRIVEEWIEIHDRDGMDLPDPLVPTDKEYSGKFLLRVDPKLHKALAIRSVQEGKSLNAYIADRLSMPF